MHTCHAHECPRRVPPRMFMCSTHWFSLKKATRDAIWREYRPGQEQDKRPSAAYLAVQQLAIGEAAFRPNDEAAARVTAGYIARALAFRKQAMADGGPDPLRGLVPVE